MARRLVRSRNSVYLLLLLALSLSSQNTAAPQEIGPEAFGLHVNRVEHWPQFGVATLRPANVAWRTINSGPGKFDWGVLDTWVARAFEEKTEIGYVFVGTPQWAASNPSERCYAGPIGCASPPRQWGDWEAFVSAVTTRYRGRIKSYELWNEPNDPQFWTGSLQQMVEMAARAYKIIHSVDPGAIVISPSPTYGLTGAPYVWLKHFLEKGGGNYAQVIGFHGYIGAHPESVMSVVRGVQEAAQAYGSGDKAIWNTEASWGRNATVDQPPWQGAFLIRSYVLQLSLGVRRFYWYQWDNPEWGTLWVPQTGLRAGGRSFQVVRDWLVGARFTEPCFQSEARRWKCKLSRNGTPFEITWDEDSTVTKRVLLPVAGRPQQNEHKPAAVPEKVQ